MQNDKQIDVFNIFHDGTITNIFNSSGNIELKIEIQYLAEIINEKFNWFYCELVDCEEFLLEIWGDEKEHTSDLNTIIAYELEILDAHPSNDGIFVSCRSDEIIGGNLHIKARNIKIYDESKKNNFS
ncbi:hypothetical protein [Aquibacillus albus]|uniref:Uncharacterized protein n=1 Tax=Aquibacillus albus TaxID=1168171 RepID=A0ABS2N6B9_9BACI|nr:hypothetical protein [Aquibacillus albus]MBM7573646.1 hypothetical protein [Aquibacillus albus]